MKTWILAGLAGCAPITNDDRAGRSGADTGGPLATDSGACAYEPLTLGVCVETTEPILVGPFYEDGVHGFGTVTEVGIGLAPVPGSDAVTDLLKCPPGPLHQVRVEDDAGVVFTFGWELGGTDLDDASLDPFAVGEDVYFLASWNDPPSDRLGVLLSNETTSKPLFLVEVGPLNINEQDRTMSVEIRKGDQCTSGGDTYYEALFGNVFEWITLWSGQFDTISLGGHTMQVVLGDSATHTEDCTERCDTDWWAAWKIP